MSETNEDPVSFERAVSVEFIRMSGGYAVKAISGQKEPAKGWDPRANTQAKSSQVLAEIETSNDNIGVHLHGDLIDVDVDGEDAHKHLIPALDRFLPDCGHVWGRKSRPRTHRAYLLKSMEPFDPSHWPVLARIKRIPEVKVEVRGGPVSRGEYSLLPGSAHPSGEEYAWADLARARNTPAVTTPDNLIRGIRMAGAVAVLAPFWAEGMRQEMTMALAGFLHRAKGIADAISETMFSLDEEQSLHFLEVLLEVSGDDRSDRSMRKKAFEKTWAKAEKEVAVTGATRVAELAGDDQILRKLYTLLTDNPSVATIDDFTARFAVWQGPALAVDLEAAKKGAQRPFMTRQNFASSYGHRFVEVGGKRKLLPEMLWSMSSAMRVQGLTFEPGQPSIVQADEGTMINQWAGFKVKPAVSPVSEDDIRPFLDYMWEVVAFKDRLCYEWVLAWVADIFQNPGDKSGTALVLVGKPGAGKSILGHGVLGKIIGDAHYATSNSVDNVTKNFNVSYTKRVLIQCDEATNSRQKAVAARLKSLITDPKQLVEPKGVDAYSIPSHARFLFTSNDEDDAIFLSGGTDDRRYTVFEVSPCRVGQIEEYWEPFGMWLENEDNLAAIHRYLLDYEYERKLIRRPTHTEARSRMQQSAWEPFDAWLAEMLSRGHPLSERVHNKGHKAYTGEQVPEKVDRTEWPEWVWMESLGEDYRLFLRSINDRRTNMNAVQIGLHLKKLGLKLDDRTIRPTVKYYDDREGVMVEKRIRLSAPPSEQAIAKYLKNKYGFEVDHGDEVEFDQPDEETEF